MAFTLNLADIQRAGYAAVRSPGARKSCGTRAHSPLAGSFQCIPGRFIDCHIVVVCVTAQIIQSRIACGQRCCLWYAYPRWHFHYQSPTNIDHVQNSQVHRHRHWPRWRTSPVCQIRTNTALRAAIPFCRHSWRKNGRTTIHWTNSKRIRTKISCRSTIYSVAPSKINRPSNSWKSIWMATIHRRIWIQHLDLYSIISINSVMIVKCCQKLHPPPSFKLSHFRFSSFLFFTFDFPI